MTKKRGGTRTYKGKKAEELIELLEKDKNKINRRN